MDNCAPVSIEIKRNGIVVAEIDLMVPRGSDIIRRFLVTNRRERPWWRRLLGCVPQYELIAGHQSITTAPSSTIAIRPENPR